MSKEGISTEWLYMRSCERADSLGCWLPITRLNVSVHSQKNISVCRLKRLSIWMSNVIECIWVGVRSKKRRVFVSSPDSAASWVGELEKPFIHRCATAVLIIQTDDAKSSSCKCIQEFIMVHSAHYLVIFRSSADQFHGFPDFRARNHIKRFNSTRKWCLS